MDIMQLRFELLSQLAGTVCDIDENKVMGSALILKQMALALNVVEQMKVAQINVGKLGNILSKIHASHAQVVFLPDLIEKAHEEIHHLLGKDADLVYLPDD